MSAFDKYIDGLVNEKETEYDFPKNESSWEELFEFGKLRIDEIISLRTQLSDLRAAARKVVEEQRNHYSVDRIEQAVRELARHLPRGQQETENEK